ncbi:MAG: M20/M25/M40 family metallo-hydrolase [Planctomycetota bacterium]
MHANHRQILTEVLSLPTAPFAEGVVIDYVRQFCRRRRVLSLTEDRAGNLLVRYRRGRATVKHPVCLTAHLDHPGFVAEQMTGPGRLRAVWRGGVRPEYFVGASVRFWVDGHWVRGVIQTIRVRGRGREARVQTAGIAVAATVPPAAVGMWDLPDPRIDSRFIRARGCDDMAGAAALLCCLDDLCRRKPSGEVYFLFTRGEEVGFIGAIAACRLKTIPARCLVVAVEMSPELPSARIGDGPVLRVGDRSSVFTPALTAFCRSVADALAKRDKSFTYQRKLMDGGTCESSAYCELGYPATGICLPLGHYHNMDLKRQRIAAEYVSTRDFENLVKWFAALVESRRAYAGHDAAFRERLGSLERQYAKLLKATRP